MEFFRVANWEQYQHYRNRDPAWIKLYARLLDHYQFASLPDTTKWHLVGIFLLASKQGNRRHETCRSVFHGELHRKKDPRGM